MTDKFIFYELDGDRYKVPAENQSDFESKAPMAKVMLTVGGENYGVPLTEINTFVGKAGANNVSYSSFDDNKKYLPEMSTRSFLEYENDSSGNTKDESSLMPESNTADTTKRNRLTDFAIAANDSLSRAQFGATKTIADEQITQMTAPKMDVDEDMASIVMNSHAENKSQIDKYIAKIDGEYDARPKAEKKWYEKLNENLTKAEFGAYADLAEQRQEDIKKGQNYIDAKIAKNISDKTGDKIEQYTNPSRTFIGGAVEGIADTVSKLDTWDSTIGAEQASRVYAIAKKLDAGKELTEGEEMIVNALVDDLASDMYLASGFGRGYKAGRVTGESLPFMLETMLNPASGMGEAITKKFGKAIFKKVASKLGAKAARAAVHGTRIASDIAGASIMSATTSQARVSADALNRLSGQVDFKVNEKDGTLEFNGFTGGEDSAFKAYAKAFGANTIEHFSEMVGNYFAPIGEMTKSGAITLANKVGLKRVGQLMEEMTPNGFGAFINDFAEQTQWHGMIGEFAEEIISGAMNALVVGDQTLKKYDKDGNINQNYLFEKDNLIDTFLGVAILGGVMSTAKTLGYTTPETRYNREIERAKKGLSSLISDKDMKTLEAFASNPFGVDYANLEPFFEESRSEESKLAVARYLKAVMAKQGYMVSREADLSGTQQGMNEMQNAYRVGQNMTEADLYDVSEEEANAMNALEKTGFFNRMAQQGYVFTQEEVAGYDSYNVFSVSEKKDIGLTAEERDALKNLALVRNAKEGLNNKLNGITNAAISFYNNISTNAATDGTLTVGFHNGKKVYIKGGVQVVNGAIVKPADVSGYPVEIVDANTGESTTVDSSEVSTVGTIGVEDYNSLMAESISNAYQQRYEGWRNTKSAKSKLAEIQQFVGQKVYIQTANNAMAEVEVQQILPNGEVLISGKKGDLGGQSTIRVDVDSFYDSMSRDANGNPIFNQSGFRSQSQGIADAQNRMYVQGQKARDAKKPTPQTPTEQQGETAEQTAEPAVPESPQPEAPQTEEPEIAPEIEDYREGTYTVLVDGVPTEVEVVGQDNTSDTIVYRYTDENGFSRTRTTGITGFRNMLREAEEAIAQPAPAPTTETPQGETTTTEEGISEPTEQTEEPINWETLLDFEPDTYLAEMQKRHGDKTVKMLNAVIDATQKQLDKLNKTTPESQEEIFQNEVKKDILQARIDRLNDMVARLTATPEEEVNEPITPEAPTTPEVPQAPVAPNPVADPISEAKKKEKQLELNLAKIGLPPEQKQDLAFNAGKAVADMFATREEYDAYAENATNFGQYNADFNRGVDESFANRSKIESDSEGNNVPLENEPNGENNGPDAENDGDLRQGGDTDGGPTNDEGAEEGGTEVPPVRTGDSNQEAEIDAKYPPRNGDATPQLLIDTFGFKSVSPNVSQNTLNTVYDFMMSMAKVLGFSPTSIGQGGTLSLDTLADNARPDASYAYLPLPDGTILNPKLKLKNKNLSSISHEWFHALDLALSYYETGKGKQSAALIPAKNFTGRPEVLEAIKEVLRAINKSGHKERLERTFAYDESFLRYSKRKDEMIARAFEEYIRMKFAEAGIDFDAYYKPYDNQPTPEEMAIIAPAFDNLFKVLQEKDGRTPNTSILYHIAEQIEQNDVARAELGELVADWTQQGGNFVVMDAETMEKVLDGKKLETPEGVVYGFVKDGIVYLNPSMMNPNTSIHEYTHLWDNALMQMNRPLWERGKALMKQTSLWNEVINDPNYADIKDNEDLVASEVHSRLVGPKGAELLSRLDAEARAEGLTKGAKKLSILGRLKEWLNEATKWLKSAFSVWSQEELDAVTLEDFLNMPMRDLANFTAIPKVGIITNENGEAVANTDGNGHTQFSISTWRDGGRDYLVNWLNKDQTLTKKEKLEIIARMDEFYENAMKYTDTYVPFGNWSEAAVKFDKDGNPLMSVIKKNGDYSMNLDFSLVCKKRRPLNKLLRALINRNAFATYTLREREIAEINWILQEHGFEVACALCFVDSKRYRVTGVADVFAQLYNRLVRAIAPEGAPIAHFNYSKNPNIESVENGIDTLPDDELNWDKLDSIVKEYGPDTVEGKVARFLRDNPSQRKLVDSTDFIDASGFEAVKEANPALLSLYNSKKGTGGPKASFGDVQYLNDILKKSRSFSAKKAYDVGGVRLQSFSDFVPHMYFDYMQLFAELAAKRLPAHAYTKEPLFAKIFGLTGIKINMSLVPSVVEGGIAPGLDADGNYAWAEAIKDKDGNVIQQGQSFPFDEAMAIQNAEGYSRNCGVIAVGISDEQIMKMLGDPNIPFIIPYHKSSLNAIVARMTNIDQYKDYTNVQNTRNADGTKLEKGTKDFNFNAWLRKNKGATPQQAAQAYLDWCKANNYMPKFSQFASHPNYYKLLVDFNTTDARTGEYTPQGAVTMTFPTEQNSFGNVETLIQQGLAEDAELEGKMDEEIEKIADEVEERLEKIKSEPKLSDREYAERMAELADERTARIRERSKDSYTPETGASQENLVSLPKVSRAIKSGKWTKDAINELNKIVEDVEEGKAILKRYTSSELAGLLEGGSLLVGASIISRGSQGNVLKSGKRIGSLEERAEETIPALTSWAKEIGAWREYSERTEEEIAHSYITSGGEAQVFYLGNGRVEKIIGLDYFVDPQLAIDRIAIHNSLFEETLLKVTGFGTNKDGNFAIIVEQPTIIGKHTDNTEIDSYIESIGFKKVDDVTRTFANEELYLSDLHEENVLNQNHERYYVIDGDFRLNTPEVGIGGTRAIDDSIVRNDTDGLLFRSSVDSEMEAIKNETIANGTFMKAPNGQPTKLNERQWLQVRTQNFLNWFGDWINDPENASKVVDENGEPLVLWRASRYDTSNNYTVFDKDKGGNYRGFYFTNKASAERRYGGRNLRSFFINLRTPDTSNNFNILQADAIDTPDVDGVIFNPEDNVLSEDYEVKVFESNQIKSATDNTGEFSPTYPDIRYRRSDIENFAVDFHVGKTRNAIIERAVNEEAKKLGVNVTYKTREEMPKGHKNDKGYYNTRTGEIVICTENASSISDAVQTILHEAVAHKGLRQLMGDRFNEFIDRVYNSLNDETKAKVDALARDHYNGNTAVAMEEYMATLAESEDFEKTSVWESIKSIFENIMNAILGRNDIKIGDNELRYILRASYNNMVNPRSMETIEGWAKDTNMREELGINEATPELLSRTGIDPAEVASQTAKAVYDRMVSTKWNEFQRQFQDAYQPVRVAVDAIQQETGNIPIEDYENYLLVQNQSPSRSGEEIDDFARRYYSPIIESVNNLINKVMEMRGLDTKDEAKRAEVYQELKQYLIAKHGLERNEYYQTHNTRKLRKDERDRENDKAKKEYDDKVDAINNDTSLTDAERQLQLRDAQDEYNAALIEIETREVPDMRDYSGLTSLFGMNPRAYKKAEDEARKFVDDFEKSLGRVDDPATGDVISQGAEIEKLWKNINSATDKTLRHSYECGLLSRQQFEDIKGMFEFYIPLRGFDETTAEDVYAYARFEGNRFNPAVETAKGRTSLADDPIAIIMNMAESEIAQGNKNRAKQALYNFLLNRVGATNRQNSLMQLEEVWYEKVVDARGNETFVLASPDRSSGETYEEFEDRMKSLEATDDAYRSKKGNKVDVGMRFQKQMDRSAHYVYLKVNGVEKAIYINGDPKAAEAINGSYRPKPMYGEDKLRTLNRTLSSTFTNYSLEFTARNFFRDMIYSRINLSVRESDPAYRKKFRQNWKRNNAYKVMLMLKAYRAGEYDGRPLTEDEASFVEFMKNGGRTGYTVINSVENHKAELERAIKRMQKGIVKGGIKDSTAFRYTLGAIELLNEASEVVTRFAAFKTSRDMGRSVVRAVSDAKEITVNFNTKGAQDGRGWMGAVAKYFGWSKFFFNASVQGVQNLKAMASANKLKFCKTVGGIAGLGFCMPIISSALYELFGGDDDNEYWNIPEYDRQNNLCIMIGQNNYIKIPLPIGFREIYAIGDMVAGMAFDKKFSRDVEQVGMDIANKIATMILPINPLESSANGLNLWHTALYTALPSSLQFMVQNATNIDWKGAPLQKEYTFNENDPQWMKAYASNPDWMVSLSKWCNENMGEGDFKGVDWSPEKLDNTLSNLFGGIYSLIKKTGNTISMAWNEEERKMSNVPLAGVVFGSGINNDEMFVTDAYYDMMEYYDDRIGFIKRRAKKFGYDLSEVFEEQKGKHHPKMQEIYNNETFDWMQEWYLGNKELESIKDKISRLEKKIGDNEPTKDQSKKLEKLNNDFITLQREFVNDMLELD